MPILKSQLKLCSPAYSTLISKFTFSFGLLLKYSNKSLFIKSIFLLILSLFFTTKVVCFKLLITSDFNKLQTYKPDATICLHKLKSP